MAPIVDFEAIRKGLSSGEFFLEYLPTVALDGGRCVGAEALARWRRPQGVLMPEEFIPAMENTPLSGLLTYWVLETAATELGAWLRANDGVHLSVNVPPEVLGRGGMAYAVTRAGLGDQVHKFVIEITERSVPDQLGIKALVHASDMGVRIALDDVSLGGANFAVLARAGVAIIKNRRLPRRADCGRRPTAGMAGWNRGAVEDDEARSGRRGRRIGGRGRGPVRRRRPARAGLLLFTAAASGRLSGVLRRAGGLSRSLRWRC